MGYYGNSLNEGYESILSKRVIEFVVNSNEFQQFVGKKLSEFDIEDFSQIGSGMGNAGEAFLKRADEAIGFLRDLAYNDPFLSMESRQWHIDGDSKALKVEVGRAINNCSWWEENRKRIKKDLRKLKTVREVMDQ